MDNYCFSNYMYLPKCWTIPLIAYLRFKVCGVIAYIHYVTLIVVSLHDGITN